MPQEVVENWQVTQEEQKQGVSGQGEGKERQLVEEEEEMGR